MLSIYFVNFLIINFISFHYVRFSFSAFLNISHESGCHEIIVVQVIGRYNYYIYSLYRNIDLDDSIYDNLLTSTAFLLEADAKALVFIFLNLLFSVLKPKSIKIY